MTGFNGGGSRDYVANYGTTPATTLSVAAATGTYGGTTNLSATLTRTSNASVISGKTITFTLNGNAVGSAVTNGSGIASLTGASLAGVNAGFYASGVVANFAGDVSFAASNGSNSLTVDPKPATWTTNAATKTYGDADPMPLTTGSGSNFLAGDGVTATYSRTAGETVMGGPYRSRRR